MPSSPPLTPSQRQICPHHRGRPQARGTELSTVPCRCTHQLGRCCDNSRAHQGPVQHHLSSGCLSSTAHTATEGAPGKEVQLEARPGQDEPAPLPGGLPPLQCFPFPCSHLGPSLGSLACSGCPREQSPPEPAPQEGRDGCTCLPQPHLVRMHLTLPGFLGNFSLLETQRCRSATFCLIYPMPLSAGISPQRAGTCCVLLGLSRK